MRIAEYMDQQADNTIKGVAYAFAVTLVGSCAGAASKWISDDVAVPVIVLVQYVICMLVIMPWLVRQPLSSLQSPRWATHLLRGLAGWLCFFSYYSALDQIPLVDATLLRNSAPLFVPLLAWLWLRARVPFGRWLPLIVGFAGVALILQPQTTVVSSGHLLGLLSGFTLAASMIGTRILSKTESGKLILFYYFLISLLCSLPFAIYHWQTPPLWTWPFLGFIGLSIYLAMWLYTRAYTFARASVVSPISYFSVVVAGFLGWLIWAHMPSNTALIGTLMVIFAGALTLYISAKKPLGS